MNKTQNDTIIKIKKIKKKKNNDLMIPNGCLYEAKGKFQTKQETNEVRRPTGPAWLGLISINISSRKYLASHD